MRLDRQGSVHRAGHPFEAVVAGAMAIGVVEGLEMVDIGNQQHEA